MCNMNAYVYGEFHSSSLKIHHLNDTTTFVHFYVAHVFC